MAITISRMPPTDALEAMTLSELAFRTDVLIQATFAKPMSAEERELYLQWKLGRLAARTGQPGWYNFKAVDDSTQKIVGVIGIQAPAKEEVAKGDRAKRFTGMPAFMITSVLDELNDKMEDVRQRHFPGDRMERIWHLKSMFVHPDYRGQGIAGKLMSRAFELVDADQMECYLEASPVGVFAYKKAGFVPIEEMPMVGGTTTVTCMLRPVTAPAASRPVDVVA